jgi:hypothetical protein
MNPDLVVVRIRTDHCTNLQQRAHAQHCLRASTHSLAQHGWSWRDHWGTLGDSLDKTWPVARGWAATHIEGSLRHRPGAWGCLLSHYTLWQQCSRDHRPWIILEQDAVALAAPDHLHIPVDLTLLKLHDHYLSWESHPLTGTWTRGAYAYLLSPTAAHTLVESVQNSACVLPVDVALGDRWLAWHYHAQPLFAVHTRESSSTAVNDPSLLDWPGVLV